VNGLSRAAGTAQGFAVQQGLVAVTSIVGNDGTEHFLFHNFTNSKSANPNPTITIDHNNLYKYSIWTNNQISAAETRPVNVALPCVIYLGRPA
jgi:hypothetical protein